jgi:diguanylate cyclase (GGDEF)-like protein
MPVSDPNPDAPSPAPLGAADARLSALLGAVERPLLLFDAQGRLERANAAAQAQLARAETSPLHPGEAPPSGHPLTAMLQRALAGHPQEALGGVAGASWEARPMHDGAGGIHGVLLLGPDPRTPPGGHPVNRSEAFWRAFLALTTATLRAESRAHPLQHVLEQAVRFIPGACAGSVITRDPDGAYRFIASVGFNLEKLQHLRLQEDDFVSEGRELVLMGDRIREERLQHAARTLLQSEVLEGSTMSIPIREDATILGYLQLNTDQQGPLFGEEDRALGELLADLLSALVQRLALERTLEREGVRSSYSRSHDPNTGLPNGALLLDRIEQALARDARMGFTTAVMIINLDHFKRINEYFGRAGGNRVLKALAQRMQLQLGDADTLAHIGGDEFVVVANGLSGMQATENLARRVHEVAQQALDLPDVTWEGGASMGVAVAPDDGTDADTLIANAELTLTRVKRSGRNSFAFFSHAIDNLVREQSQLGRDLRHAVSTGQGFHVAFQPLVRLADGACVGLEALARWTHPERGAISPAIFGPMTEDLGLIHLLSARVFQDATSSFARLRASGIGERWRLYVNVSPLEVMQGDLLSLARAALQRAGLRATDLELELTETSALEGSRQAIATVNRLRAHGIRIAIDDFGTGYASLQRLANVPADTVKIDQSFVQSALHDMRDAAVIDAIVALAKSLGFQVIAEGIETREQFEMMRFKGCDIGQGYHFAPPLPIDEIGAWLQQR